MKRYLARIILGLTVTSVLLLHTTGILIVPILDQVENIAYDARLRLAAPGGVDERIVIVAIDETSLRDQGHWPWTREKLATMLERLFLEYDVAVVGFDVVFAERDESHDLDRLRAIVEDSGDADLLRDLETFVDRLDRDDRFAEALALGPAILGYYFDTDPTKSFKTGELPMAAFEFHPSMAGSIHLPKASGFGGNLPVLMEAAYGAGFISNPLIATDGIVRRAPLLHEYSFNVYESLSLAVAAAYLGDITLPDFVEQERLAEGYPALESIELAGNSIPIDSQGAILVSYRGPAGSFPYISATDVISGNVDDPERLKDAIVLVGATAAGLLDLRSTPFGPVYPGVEVHANVIANILDQSTRWQPAYSTALEFIVVSVFGLLASTIIPLLSAIVASLFTWFLIAAALGFNWYLWEVQQHVLPIAATLVLCLGVYVLNMFYGYFVEGRTREYMNSLFGQYVPPKLVAQMSLDPKHYTLAGEKKELTVLFSDVRGFTSISERLDPAELSELLNSFLTPMTRIVHEHRGTIDKYIGDAIMAFWGAPVDDEQHAPHTVAAALAMQRSVRDLNVGFEERGWPTLRIGIGINTGVMNVGNMGSSFRRAYTVLGDAVNIASRIEGLTKVYGVDIIVSDRVVQKAPEYLYREIDLVRVKGRDEPVALYQPLVLASEASDRQRELARRSVDFLASYRRQDWNAAEEAVAGLGAVDADSMYADEFCRRIVWFRDNPPSTDGWDGVHNLDTK